MVSSLSTVWEGGCVTRVPRQGAVLVLCVVTVGLYSDIIHSGEVLGIVSPWVGGEVCGE